MNRPRISAADTARPRDIRIGIFGNSNNYPFLLATGFRALGVDVSLVLSSKDPLNRPVHRWHYLWREYPRWVLDGALVEEDIYLRSEARAEAFFRGAFHDVDAVLLNHFGPACAHWLKVPHLALLTGSDLTYYGNPVIVDVRESSWSPEFRSSEQGLADRAVWLSSVQRQRAGIRNAAAVSFATKGLVPEGDAMLEEIGVPEDRRFFVFMADTLTLKYSPPRGNTELRILNGARINWCRPLPPGFVSQDDKGTDILVRGFAQFLGSGGRGTLVLVRKGLHVNETKMLADELGIGSAIEWHDEMPLDDLHAQMRRADVVCDQFGTSFPAMVANDAMALGRPVLANFRLESPRKGFSGDLPACNATSPEEVCAQLHRLQTSPTLRFDLGKRARRFAEKFLSPEANARKCLEHLGLAADAEKA